MVSSLLAVGESRVGPQRGLICNENSIISNFLNAIEICGSSPNADSLQTTRMSIVSHARGCPLIGRNVALQSSRNI